MRKRGGNVRYTKRVSGTRKKKTVKFELLYLRDACIGCHTSLLRTRGELLKLFDVTNKREKEENCAL